MKKRIINDFLLSRTTNSSEASQHYFGNGKQRTDPRSDEMVNEQQDDIPSKSKIYTGFVTLPIPYSFCDSYFFGLDLLKFNMASSFNDILRQYNTEL